MAGLVFFSRFPAAIRSLLTYDTKFGIALDADYAFADCRLVNFF